MSWSQGALACAMFLACASGARGGTDTYEVVSNADSGPGSLREAILLANQVPGTIHIAWGGFTPDRIQLLSPLPLLEHDSVINGYFQNGLDDPRRGVEIDGSLITGPDVVAMRVGSNNEIKGLSITNVRSAAGTGVGLRIEGSGNVIQGVYLGLDIDGTVARGNDIGMLVTGGPNQLGDPSGLTNPNRYTRILASGNRVGIAIMSASASGNVIHRTSIGLDVQGRPAPNNSHGLHIVDAPDTRIGAQEPIRRVAIAHNGGDGVRVEGPLAGATMRQNPVHSNGGLAFDLAGDGVTANDTGDGDSGPNGLQNYPVIDSVVGTATGATIQGHLDAAPIQAFDLDFYASAQPDRSGHGEAESFLNSIPVVTNAAGQATFTFDVPGLSSLRPFVSATASDSAGHTSELSLAVQGSGLPDRGIFTVNSSANPPTGLCLAEACSLNQAIVAANDSPNGAQPDLIRFAIPGPGPVTIPAGALQNPIPTITEAVEIDGYTQPGSSPNTIPFGAGGLDSVIQVDVVGDGFNGCFRVVGGGSIFRGLAVSACGSGIRLDSDDNVVEGCYLGPAASGALTKGNLYGIHIGGSSNRVGRPTPAARNLISGNESAGVRVGGLLSADNLIQGNLVGTTRDGHGALPNRINGVHVAPETSGSGFPRARGTVIGGTAAGEGNVISGNFDAVFLGNGVHLSALGGEVDGSRVEGNFLGLDAEGDDVLPNRTDVMIAHGNAHDNVVGGLGAGQRNWMAGAMNGAVWIREAARENTIVGNDIGLSVTGAVIGPGFEAVRIDNSSDNRVVGNRIRGAAMDAVHVARVASPFAPPIARGNVLSRNSISGSGGLAIALGFDGVTPNDPGDVDEGENDLINFPVVTGVSPGGAVAGVYSGLPGADVTIEAFANATPSPSGHGEAETFLGGQTVLTDASGNASFLILGAPIPPGASVSATATFASGTSELGPATAASVTVSRRELTHGARLDADLAGGAGNATFSLLQSPRSSYEVVVDAVAGLAAPVLLERVDASGTVIQPGSPAGAGSSVSLRWQNATSSAVVSETIRVRSGGCTSSCGAGDRFRIRSYETTEAAPRFNNVGTQGTVMLLQNPTDADLDGTLYFWSGSGQLLHEELFAVPAHGLFVRALAGVSALAGRAGSVTAIHDGSFGALVGKAVLLEPSTGFSFDTPLSPKGR